MCRVCWQLPSGSSFGLVGRDESFDLFPLQINFRLALTAVFPRLVGRRWFKSYSNQEGSLSVKVPAIRRIQKPRLTERTQRVPRRSQTQLLSRTTCLASRGSSYTKAQAPMESDKEPPGPSNTTVPAFFPFVLGSAET